MFVLKFGKLENTVMLGRCTSFRSFFFHLDAIAKISLLEFIFIPVIAVVKLRILCYFLIFSIQQATKSSNLCRLRVGEQFAVRAWCLIQIDHAGCAPCSQNFCTIRDTQRRVFYAALITDPRDQFPGGQVPLVNFTFFP